MIPAPYRPGAEFTFTGRHGDASAFTGRHCVIVRQLDSSEVDEAEVGRMYRVRFDDGKPGRELDAFEEELQ